MLATIESMQLREVQELRPLLSGHEVMNLLPAMQVGPAIKKVKRCVYLFL